MARLEGWLSGGEEEKAERLLNEELVRRNRSEKDLGAKPKTDRQTTRIALRLRRETTKTLAWLGRRLQMGSVNALKNTLRQPIAGTDLYACRGQVRRSIWPCRERDGSAAARFFLQSACVRAYMLSY